MLTNEALDRFGILGSETDRAVPVIDRLPIRRASSAD
jgi:hypothetical protein